jgi:hypothetical protein
MPTYTTASSGWNCVSVDGSYEWQAWNEHGNLRGRSDTIEDARAQASKASEILEGDR